MVYLIIFLLATIFSVLAQKNRGKKNLFLVFSSLAILIPALLAALRSTSIGTDVEVYVVPLFKYAVNNNFFVFLDTISAYDIEFLFEVLIFISAKLFSNLNITLFFIHFPICLLFYIAANNNRDKASPCLIYILFLLTYYNMSLNIMRQFIAVAIIFSSFKNIEEDKYFKYILNVIIASLFHSTALIGLLFIFIYKACKSKRRLLYSIILIIALCVGMLSYNELLVSLYNLGIIPYKYVERYSITNNSININFADEIIRIYHLFLIFSHNKLMKNTKDNIFYNTIAIFDFILVQISLFVPFAQRICIYFTVFSFLNIPRIIKQTKINKSKLTYLTIILYIVYFIYVYIYIGVSETYPFKIGV